MVNRDEARFRGKGVPVESSWVFEKRVERLFGHFGLMDNKLKNEENWWGDSFGIDQKKDCLTDLSCMSFCLVFSYL